MPHLIPRMQHHCELSAPLKKSDAPLTLAKYPTNEFRLLMPTIELFDGKLDDGDWFLEKSVQTNRIVLLWIVDTKESLRKALSMQSIHGGYPIIQLD